MSVLVLLTIIHLSTSPSSTFSIWQQHRTATSKWTFCLNKKIDVWQGFICFLAHQQSGCVVTGATRQWSIPMVYLFTTGEGSQILFILVRQTHRRNKTPYTSPQRQSQPSLQPAWCLLFCWGRPSPSFTSHSCQKLQSRTCLFCGVQQIPV